MKRVTEEFRLEETSGGCLVWFPTNSKFTLDGLLQGSSDSLENPKSTDSFSFNIRGN